MRYINTRLLLLLLHTPKEHWRGAHLPFIGRWARRWINHYCLRRMASATPDLRLPFQPKLVLIAHTHIGMARLSWPEWLVTYRDSLPARRRSCTHTTWCIALYCRSADCGGERGEMTYAVWKERGKLSKGELSGGICPWGICRGECPHPVTTCIQKSPYSMQT